jgi:hypothetical protein
MPHESSRSQLPLRSQETDHVRQNNVTTHKCRDVTKARERHQRSVSKLSRALLRLRGDQRVGVAPTLRRAWEAVKGRDGFVGGVTRAGDDQDPDAGNLRGLLRPSGGRRG